MSWRRVRGLLLITLLGALAFRVVRSLRGPEAPAFTRHPSAWDGQVVRTEAGAREREAPTAAVPPPSVPASRPAEVPPAATDGSWVPPVDGACPPGHPIKAKERSGIFHEPGMLAYERTNPDRCYATAQDAVADGFRAAKR